MTTKKSQWHLEMLSVIDWLFYCLFFCVTRGKWHVSVTTACCINNTRQEKGYVASPQHEPAAEEAHSLDFKLNIISPVLVCNQPYAPDANCHEGGDDWEQRSLTLARCNYKAKFLCGGSPSISVKWEDMLINYRGGGGGMGVEHDMVLSGSTDGSWLPICRVVSFTTVLDCAAVWSLVYLHLESQPRILVQSRNVRMICQC